MSDKTKTPEKETGKEYLGETYAPPKEPEYNCEPFYKGQLMQTKYDGKKI